MLGFFYATLKSESLPSLVNTSNWTMFSSSAKVFTFGLSYMYASGFSVETKIDKYLVFLSKRKTDNICDS